MRINDATKFIYVFNCWHFENQYYIVYKSQLLQRQSTSSASNYMDEMYLRKTAPMLYMLLSVDE